MVSNTNPSRAVSMLGAVGLAVVAAAVLLFLMNMTNVTRLHHALPMSTNVTRAILDLDNAIAKAVDAAKAVGLPQGMIVAILHGHAHAETHRMVAN